MAKPRPRIVVILAEKIDTDVKRVSTRRTVKDPRIPMAPIASGSPAAVRLPKMRSNNTSKMGNDRLSARPMSFVVWFAHVLRL